MTTPALKVDVAISPVSTTNGATASGLIDTLACDWLTLDVIAGTASAASVNPSVLSITECDTSDGSFTAITALTGDGSGGFTIPNADTAADWIVKFNLDLLGRKRWLQVDVSPTTTQIVTAIANMGRKDEAPINSTKAGCHALIED